MKDKRILPVLTDEEMGKKVLAALNENFTRCFYCSSVFSDNEFDECDNNNNNDDNVEGMVYDTSNNKNDENQNSLDKFFANV